MDTQPAFGFRELLNHVVGDMAKAVCERGGESKQQQFARYQATVHMIMGFLPRDVIEAILAGHCVMFHEMMTDSVRVTLRGEADGTRRATRGNIVAMDKVFGNNLARLERYQTRPAEGRRDAPEVLPSTAPNAAEPGERMPAPAEPALSPAAHADAAPIQVPPMEAPQGLAPQGLAPQGLAPMAETRDVPLRTALDALPPHLREAMIDYQPAPETIAACRANLEAMAALEAGDAERFAQAMGIDMPSEAYITAASTPGSPFDRKASGPAAGSSTGGARG